MTMTAAVMTKTIMMMIVGRGAAVAVMKTEPPAGAEVAEAVAVAKMRADNN